MLEKSKIVLISKPKVIDIHNQHCKHQRRSVCSHTEAKSNIRNLKLLITK